MDLEGHFLQNTISHCISLNETWIKLHFFHDQLSANTRDKSTFILGNIQDWNVFVNFIIFYHFTILVPIWPRFEKKVILLLLLK